MATIVLEGVKTADLPADWKKRIKAKPNETVRVTIDREIPAAQPLRQTKPNHTFGMWADRKDIGDAGEYVRALRQARNAARG